MGAWKSWPERLVGICAASSTNPAFRRVATRAQVAQVMHVSASSAHLLAHSAEGCRLSELRAAMDEMKIQEGFVVRTLSRHLGETALLMVELHMEERFDEYVGIIEVHGVLSGAVTLVESRRLAA